MSQLNVNPDVSTHNHCDPVRVVVIDDSAVVRGLVSRWIDGEPDLVTVGKFSNGQQAVDGVEGVAPDVIVLDIEMPVMDGVTALPMLLEKLPDAKVIIATTLSPRNAEISLKALTLGAVDYIPKPAGNAGITTSETFRKDLLARIKAVGLAKTGHPQMQPDVRGIRLPC